MKIEYRKQAISPLKTLGRLERNGFVIAVIVAFISVFVWFFKILFF